MGDLKKHSRINHEEKPYIPIILLGQKEPMLIHSKGIKPKEKKALKIAR